MSPGIIFLGCRQLEQRDGLEAFFPETYHVWGISNFSWSLSFRLYSLTPLFIIFSALDMLWNIWLRKHWKEETPMSVCASNWPFSLILKRYKNTHTTWWHVVRAAVCCCVWKVSKGFNRYRFALGCELQRDISSPFKSSSTSLVLSKTGLLWRSVWVRFFCQERVVMVHGQRIARHAFDFAILLRRW